MNNWSAVGYIFLGFGLVFFLLAVFIGILASSTFETVNSGLVALGLQNNAWLTAGMRSAMLLAMVPWIVTAALCWVVAVVGVVAGSKKKTVQAKFA
jgi:hypothetical protein